MAYIKDYSDFKDFVLAQNPYFDMGFANVFKDKQSNLLLHRELSGDLLAVFPMDTYGNYFYLRNDEGFSISPDIALSCNLLSLSLTASISLVAVLNGANEDILASNLLKTISNFKGFRLFPNTINWNREQIIIDEMSGADENDILKALQNLGNKTIMRIKFQAVTQYSANNCSTVNPCNC